MTQKSDPEGALVGPSRVLSGTVVPPAGPGLSPAAKAAAAKGVAASTKRAYDKDWRLFTVWCGQNGRTPLPATAETLTEYTNYLCYDIVPGGDYHDYLAASGRRGLSLSAINRALSAIAVKHRKEGFDPPPRDTQDGVIDILRGYKEKLALAQDPRALPKQAPAVTHETLELVRDTESTRLKELRDRTIVLLGFAMGARISELRLLNVESVQEFAEGLQVAVYRQKTRTHNKVRIPRADVPGVVDAVCTWIRTLADAGYTSGPLFPRIDRHGNLGPGGCGRTVPDDNGRMTAISIGRIIRAQLRRVGADGTGHSLRSGMATEARKLGHDQVTIAEQGGWAPNSAAMLGYMRNADGWNNNALKGMNL